MTQLEQSESANEKMWRRRVGVMVLGMHRSGTSLLSRLLSLDGCDLPKNLLPANEANTEGYWESAVVVAFNDTLLASGGSNWHDWLGFNPGWYDSPKKDEYLYRARDILKSEFDSSGLFVLKDPRICRLVPFWLEVLEQEGIEPGIVLPIRHPAMVARSLAMRDSIALPIGQLLWLRHVLDAEATTRGRRRTIVTFTQLLEDWPTLRKRMSLALDVQWPKIGQVSRAEQAGFINPAMAHSEAALQNHPQGQNLSTGVVEAWTILANWAETGEKTSDYAALDVLREQLDRAGDITGEAIILSMNSNWLLLERGQQVDELKGQLTAQIEDAKTAAKSFEEEKRQLRQDVDALSLELIKTQASAQVVEADRSRLAERSDDLQAKLSVTQSNLQQRYAELDQLRHDLERMQDIEQQKKEKDDQLQTEITAAREIIAASEKNASVMQQELEDTNNRLKSMIERSIFLEKDAEHLRNRLYIVEAARDDANRRNHNLENSVDILRIQDIRVVRLTEEVQNARAQADRARRESREYAQAAEHLSVSVRQYEEDISRLRNEAVDAQSQANILLQKIERKAQEHHFINQELFNAKKIAQDSFEQQQWLLAINQAIIEPGRWWMQFLPLSYRERMVRRRLARRGLFDSDAYLSRYDDVARSGMNPLQHYIRHGIYEGRMRI